MFASLLTTLRTTARATCASGAACGAGARTFATTPGSGLLLQRGILQQRGAAPATDGAWRVGTTRNISLKRHLKRERRLERERRGLPPYAGGYDAAPLPKPPAPKGVLPAMRKRVWFGEQPIIAVPRTGGGGNAKLAKDEYCFRCAPSMTRWELRQYLERLYGLEVEKVYKTVNYDGALRRIKKLDKLLPGSPPKYAFQKAYKMMYVRLAKGSYPQSDFAFGVTRKRYQQQIDAMKKKSKA